MNAIPATIPSSDAVRMDSARLRDPTEKDAKPSTVIISNHLPIFKGILLKFASCCRR